MWRKIRKKIRQLIYGKSWRYQLNNWLDYYLLGAYEARFGKKDMGMLLPPLTLLDIGTGNYGYVKENYKEKFNITCLDKVKTPFVDVIGDVQELNKLNKSFDIITCLETFEHIKNPFLAAEQIYTALNDNGFVLFSAPFYYPIHGNYGDYWRFTEDGWIILLKKFKQVKIEMVGNHPRPIHYLIKAYK